MTRATGRGPQSPLPDHCFNETLQRVGVSDTDLMGIVHHANYVVYFERGRLEYMRRRAFPYKLMVDRGLHLPVVELDIRYRKPAHFDDLLCIMTRLGALSRVTVRFDYSVARVEPAREPPDRLLEGHVLLACVDKGNRPRPLPEDIVEALLARELASSS